MRAMIPDTTNAKMHKALGMEIHILFKAGNDRKVRDERRFQTRQQGLPTKGLLPQGSDNPLTLVAGGANKFTAFEVGNTTRLAIIRQKLCGSKRKRRGNFSKKRLYWQNEWITQL